MRWVDQAFTKLDLNGDGFISLEEIMHKLPLMTTDPDDDIDSERLLEVCAQSAVFSAILHRRRAGRQPLSGVCWLCRES